MRFKDFKVQLLKITMEIEYTSYNINAMGYKIGLKFFKIS